MKIGRHNFSFYCVLALAGYFPFVFHFFFNGPSPQSTASGKLFLPSLFSFNLLVPVHMFLCVSFYHSFFSFVLGNLVGWKIWVCTEICFISFNCEIFYCFCIKIFPVSDDITMVHSSPISRCCPFESTRDGIRGWITEQELGQRNGNGKCAWSWWIQRRVVAGVSPGCRPVINACLYISTVIFNRGI